MAILLLTAPDCLIERETCTNNDRGAFICFNNIFRLFPSGGRKTNCAAFCTNRLEVLQGMSRLKKTFPQKDRRSDRSVFRIERNLGEKLDPTTLKPGHLKE